MNHLTPTRVLKLDEVNGVTEETSEPPHTHTGIETREICMLTFYVLEPPHTHTGIETVV